MKSKRLPRLWCALQGLLPVDACLAAQRGELAWPVEPPSGRSHELPVQPQVRRKDAKKRERRS